MTPSRLRYWLSVLLFGVCLLQGKPVVALPPPIPPPPQPASLARPDPANLIRQLQQGDSDQRFAAAARLIYFEETTARDALSSALHDDPNPIMRAQIARLLGERRRAWAVPALVAALQDDFALVRAQAINALGMTRTPEAVDALLGLLKGEDVGQRVQATEALGQAGDVRAVAALTTLLQDSEERVRAAAARSLGMLNARQAAETLAALLDDLSPRVRRQAGVALARFHDPRGIPALRYALQDADVETQRFAVEHFCNTKDAEVVRLLIAILNTPDQRLLARTADALAFQGDRRAVSPLLTAARSEDHNAQQRITAALQALADNSARAALLNTAYDVDPHVRAIAVAVLGHFTDNQVISLLLNATRDGDHRVRVAATNSLAAIRTPAMTARLLALVKGPANEMIRVAAARALKGRGLDAGAVKQLIAVLNGPRGTIRVAVVETLGSLKSPLVVAPLLDAANGKDALLRWTALSALAGHAADVRVLNTLIAALQRRGDPMTAQYAEQSLRQVVSKPYGAAKVVPRLVPMLQNADYTLRRYIVLLLCQANTPQSRLALIPLLSDPADDVSAQAHAALRNPAAQTPAVKAALAARLADPKETHKVEPAIALGAMGDNRALPVLLNSLKNLDPQPRKRIIECLGELGDPRAMPALLAELQNRASPACAGAAIALGKMHDPRAVQPLLELLTEPAPAARVVAAATALGELKATAAVDPLIALLGTMPEAYARQIAAALQAITGQDFGTDPARWQAWRQGAGGGNGRF